MSTLIEGLPDDITLSCLARVPVYLYPKLEFVSCSWRNAIHSKKLFKARQELNSTEEYICVCTREMDKLWQLYDPKNDLWVILLILPSNIPRFYQFGVACTSGKLFVIGGGSNDNGHYNGPAGCFATDEVWSYDPVARHWTLCAPLIIPRVKLACCVLDGKIIVAGGFTNRGKLTTKAEMYDPDEDAWISIPNLPRTFGTECTGLIIGGKVHVMHWGSSAVQILEDIKQGWTVHDNGCTLGPRTVVKDKLYANNYGRLYVQETDSKKLVVPYFEFRRRVCYGMIGLGDDMYIIGGVKGHDWLNQHFTQTSDVDVLTPGDERPVLRPVAPMTRCRGFVLGCTVLKI